MSKIIFITVLAVAMSISVASAQPGSPTLDQKLTLEALGGVTFDVPAWTTVTSGDSSAVLEQKPDVSAKPPRPFMVLLFAIEKAPDKDIDWAKVKANIEKAASGAERTLTLTSDAAFTLAEGFDGRVMSGTYTSGKQSVGFELISLFKAGKLLTVSLVSAVPDTNSRALLTQVAKTADINL